MQKATWNDAFWRKAIRLLQLEGNQYFPLDSLNKELFQGK